MFSGYGISRTQVCVRLLSSQRQRTTLEGNRKASSGSGSRQCYAIYCGAGGFTGIVKNSQEARTLTSGVAGAKSRTCSNEQEAKRFVNFWLRKAGAGRLSLDDLNAAASTPVEVDEEQVVEAADEGKEEPESEEFWTVLVARARANEQGAEGHQLFQEICLEYGVTAQDHYEEYCKLARFCYGPIEEHQL